mmetsp:Transcript_130208/g.229253  ORF Transcript_130208/g.229253 Transcript_130208/m.229253 type:complete len:109 (-) Transcript_130208:213-539(-)
MGTTSFGPPPSKAMDSAIRGNFPISDMVATVDPEYVPTTRVYLVRPSSAHLWKIRQTSSRNDRLDITHCRNDVEDEGAVSGATSASIFTRAAVPEVGDTLCTLLTDNR